MPNFNKKDGWRTAGTRQLTKAEIVQLCNYADKMFKRGYAFNVVLQCQYDNELDKARESWAGFVMFNNVLRYKGVEVRKG